MVGGTVLSLSANDVHYPLDYGTVMPMVCYLDRAQKLPLVPVSVCLSADLAESFLYIGFIEDPTSAESRERRLEFFTELVEHSPET